MKVSDNYEASYCTCDKGTNNDVIANCASRGAIPNTVMKVSDPYTVSTVLPLTQLTLPMMYINTLTWSTHCKTSLVDDEKLHDDDCLPTRDIE